MTAKYGNFAAPADEGIAVTKNDTTVLAQTRGLYVGVTGDVAVKFAGGDQNVVTIPSVPAGAVLPISVIKVMSTNTTASGFVALW